MSPNLSDTTIVSAVLVKATAVGFLGSSLYVSGSSQVSSTGKKTNRSLTSFRPSTSQSFNILSSPDVTMYLSSESTAEQRIGPDFDTDCSCSSGKVADEQSTSPVLGVHLRRGLKGQSE